MSEDQGSVRIGADKGGGIRDGARAPGWTRGREKYLTRENGYTETHHSGHVAERGAPADEKKKRRQEA